MSGATGPERELTPEEVATALDWIDGNLGVDAAIEFELRLAAEPELAARVEALARMDQRMARQRLSAPPRARWGRWLALAAAAALIATLTIPRLLGPREPAFEVPLAPGHALAEDWIHGAPALVGQCAPGIAMSRGENPTVLAPAEFLRRAALAEGQLIDQALGSGAKELEAGWFVVPLELAEPASVLLFAWGERGAPQRLFPTSEAAALPIPAGRSLLPGPRAVGSADGAAVRYQPGFLVPRGVGQWVVLVAVRTREVGAEELRRLEEELATREHGPGQAHLEEQGFEVRRLIVREPR